MEIKVYGGITVKFHCNKEELRETHLIYLLKFKNGKYYVGQTNTKLGLLGRIQSHCYESKSNAKKRNIYKDNIIKKYKEFDVFILKKCTVKDIDFFEMFYISILNRVLVNIEDGGCENKTQKQSTREKISEKLKQFYKKNPKIININVYDLEGNFVRSHKTIGEMIEYYHTNWSIIGNCLYKKRRKFLGKYQIFKENEEDIVKYKEKINIVYAYDYISGKFVKEIDLSEEKPRDRYKIVEKMKNNRSYHKLIFSYEKKERITPPESKYVKISMKLSKPILQLDDDLNIIKKWKNAREASEFYNISSELIRQVCVRWRRHCKNFVWCYENEYDWYKEMWGEKLVRKR